MFNLFARIPRQLGLLMALALSVSACSSPEQKAQKFYEHGMQLAAEDKPAYAAVEFKNAIKYKKDLIPAWRGLAQLDEKEHKWPELISVFRQITELDPKDSDTKIKLARLLLVGGATDQALKLVTDLDSNNANVLALKATISFKLKDNAAGVSEAKAALKIDPSNIDATMVLAADRLQSGDAKGALQILSIDAVAKSNDLGVQLFKIKIFEQLGDKQQIEGVLQKLVELYPKEPAFRQQLVKFYIDQHRLDDAEAQLRAMVVADPKSSQSVLNLVRFLLATKGAVPARAELVNHIHAGGDIFPYQMALADFDYAQGNVADSFKLLQTLAENSTVPDQAQAAKLKLAEFNLARKNIDVAEALIADILQKDNRNVNALRLRAVIHMSRDQLEPAVSDLREALNDQPRSTELMLMLATAYERMGSIELAEKEYADATRVSNYDPNVGLSYVAFLRRRGSTQRAADVLSDLASRKPNNIAILTALAEVKLVQQDWPAAQEIGESIKRLGTNEGVADQILGASFSGQQKFGDSIAAFQSAVAAAPSATQPMVSLVRTLIQAKQTDRAVAFLQSVLKSNPSNAEALVLLGSVQIANNAPDQAIKSFMSAIDKQPKDIIGYRALADLYIKQKNPDQAFKIIQAGLVAQPNNVVLHMSLAGIYELQSNYDGAIKEYEYVLAQQPGSMVAANNLASLLSDHRTDKASIGSRARARRELAQVAGAAI